MAWLCHSALAPLVQLDGCRTGKLIACHLMTARRAAEARPMDKPIQNTAVHSTELQPRAGEARRRRAHGQPYTRRQTPHAMLASWHNVVSKTARDTRRRILAQIKSRLSAGSDEPRC